MSDDSGGHTRDQLLDAKLELIRQAMASGFERMESALTQHVRDDDDAHKRLEVAEARIRELELEAARESTKLKLLMAAMSVGSSGLGAALAKFVL